MFFRHPLLSLIPNHLIFYPTPANLTYFWGFGSLAGIFLVSQILTGVFLAMHYTPHIDLAFASIEHIMRNVNYGWFIRYLHANGASFFFFVVYLHIGRSLYFGFFNLTRRFLWMSGVLIFILMMAIAFMGYVLPWGQMSFWGATVITNLFTALPFVGEPIAYWLWGGFSVSNATLTRFFSLHYLLPFVLVGLVGLHLLLLHQNGSHNPLSVNHQGDKIPFYPYFYVKDYFGLLTLFFFVILVITYYPDVLGHSDNYIEANALVTPAHIVPEWYFLPFYAILRSVPNKLGGVVAMGLAIAILLVLPFYRATSRSLFIRGRLLYTWFFWLFAFSVLFLGYLGGRPIEEPYTLFSQVLTFYYFFFFAVYILLDYTFGHYFYYFNHLVQKDNAIVQSGFFVALTLGKKSTLSPLFRTWLCQRLTNLQAIIVGSRLFVVTRIKTAFQQKRGTLAPDYKHPFHLVNASPWPFLISLSLGGLVVGVVLWFHGYTTGVTTLLWGLLSVLLCLTCWFRDVVREGTFEGHHTKAVQWGLQSGMLLFILSEVMFFFSFFWGFFHSSLAPSIDIGGVWPPKGIEVFDPWAVPFLNTIILVTSGATVTWSHFATRVFVVRSLGDVSARVVEEYKNREANVFEMFSLFQYRNFLLGRFRMSTKTLALVFFWFNSCLAVASDLIAAARSRKLWSLSGKDRLLVSGLSEASLPSLLVLGPFARQIALGWPLRLWLASKLPNTRYDVLYGLMGTVFLGVLFTLLQFYEYRHAAFTISDSIYGSTFFLTTGFHGLHVLIGTIFLFVCFIRMLSYHFTQQHHVGLESAIWYWHFVDVVWLGLYISIYHWGGVAV